MIAVIYDSDDTNKNKLKIIKIFFDFTRRIWYNKTKKQMVEKTH
jgi:hypothetical protein